MKEVVNANLGIQAFTFDEDAYRLLSKYLEAIRTRLPSEDRETLDDIKARLSEIIRGGISSPMMVVTLAMVQSAMARMGDPSEFGGPSVEAGNGIESEREDAEPEQPSYSSRHLYRSRTNRTIAGICGGVAEFFNIDIAILRLITLLLILFGGLSLWVYIILWIVIPLEPISGMYSKLKKKNA